MKRVAWYEGSKPVGRGWKVSVPYLISDELETRLVSYQKLAGWQAEFFGFLRLFTLIYAFLRILGNFFIFRGVEITQIRGVAGWAAWLLGEWDTRFSRLFSPFLGYYTLFPAFHAFFYQRLRVEAGAEGNG
jgi:hypothetical protein